METEKKEKSILQNSVFLVANNMFNMLFLLVSATYAARILSLEGVGKVAYGQNIVQYFVVLATFGIPYYGTREIARSRHFPEEKNKLFSELVSLNLITTAVCSAAYCGLVAWRFSDNLWFYLICGLELFCNFAKFDWLFEGYEDYGYIMLRNLGVKAVSLAALFLLVRDAGDYPLYALFHCIGILGNCLCNLISARKKVQFRLRGLSIKRHLYPVFFLLLSGVASSLYTNTNVTVLGSMESDEMLGLYVNAQKVMTVIHSITTAISAGFFPKLSRSYAESREKYKEHLSLGVRIVLLLAVPGCIGIIVAAPNLVTVLFGDEFLRSAQALRIMAPYLVIKGLGDLLCYQVIISIGKENRLIGAYLVAGAVSILLNILLIPYMGYCATALMMIISEMIVIAMLLPVSLRVAKPVVGWKFVGSVAFSSVLMGLVAALVQHLLGDGVLSLAATVLSGVAVYGVCLLLTKNELLANVKKWLRHRRGEEM